MDTPLPRRPNPRPPSRLRRTRLGVAVLLLAAASVAGGATQRFAMHATLQPKPVTPSGGGFELQARLTPAAHTLQGGGYSVDAIAAPAASCGDDRIFKNGFEGPLMR